MEITEASVNDLDEMIELLKLSLGESLLPKSKAFWQWKHIDNPFGVSKVLLAKEDGRIIGLRAFMKWQWQSNSELVTAVRAVDTATHPDYQGKGIFSRLTKKAVEECLTENVNMVFNTPNDKSRPGYLKMGWLMAGKIPLCLRPGSLFPSFYNPEKLNVIYNEYPVSNVIDLLKGVENKILLTENKQTVLSATYINWRYNQCPVIKYGAAASPGEFYFVFRVKPIKKFMELRICEGWIADEKSAKWAAVKCLKSLKKRIKPVIITAAPVSVKGITFWGPFNRGPVATVRPLNRTDLTDFTGFSKWAPSLGAMELF